VRAQVQHSPLALPDTIRRTATAEFENTAIRRTPSAELEQQAWQVPADKLFYRLPISHLTAISKIDDPLKRAFYEIETIKGCWTYDELDRQISTLYYERSGLSKDKEGLSKLVNQTAQNLSPKDVLHNPVALEFLDLESHEKIDETDIETAILNKMQTMLLELGNGFCFEARQKRILIDGDYYKIDLVFYHRVLKCHFLVELKIDKFHHEYASQLNMYLNYYKHEVMTADDNPPIGLLLCADYGETVVKYATGGLDPNLFVQKYHIQLPTEEEIKAFIAQSIRSAE
jgi:predicted nuclease of restriction endonuclease-like (RecB) superfamily